MRIRNKIKRRTNGLFESCRTQASHSVDLYSLTGHKVTWLLTKLPLYLMYAYVHQIKETKFSTPRIKANTMVVIYIFLNFSIILQKWVMRWMTGWLLLWWFRRFLLFFFSWWPISTGQYRAIIIIFLAKSMLLIFSFTLYNTRRKKFEKDLMNEAWIIDFNQIMLCTVENKFASKVGEFEKKLE